MDYLLCTSPTGMLLEVRMWKNLQKNGAERTGKPSTGEN